MIWIQMKNWCFVTAFTFECKYMKRNRKVKHRISKYAYWIFDFFAFHHCLSEKKKLKKKKMGFLVFFFSQNLSNTPSKKVCTLFHGHTYNQDFFCHFFSFFSWFINNNLTFDFFIKTMSPEIVIGNLKKIIRKLLLFTFFLLRYYDTFSFFLQ